MNCETALDVMLEADLNELRGDGKSELAEHVRTCPECRLKADTILAGQNALAAVLETIAARAPGTDVIRRVRVTASRRPWRVALPVALAASIGSLLLLRQPPPMPQTIEPPVRAGAAALDVRVPGGRNVAVFQTDNPDIVVIWSY